MNTESPSQPATPGTAQNTNCSETGHSPASVAASKGVFWVLFRLVIAPVLVIAMVIGGIFLVGVAQRTGWIQSPDDGHDGTVATVAVSNVSYICPMMCVPPQPVPGRCPVCGMELVQAASQSSGGPSSTISIDPRARRIANIQTIAAGSRVMHREIHGVGEIKYDESSLKTLSAYIDGRIEELHADYTGIVVNRNDQLALLYSPEIYSSQIEYVQAVEAAESTNSQSTRLAETTRRLLASSRQRLVELGMTGSQIDSLATSKNASSRLELHAPISGTVIEKLAVVGQYIKAGEPIYRLADLSKVWLVLRLFPEDAAAIRPGQPVDAAVQSQPGEPVGGIVDFVEPVVDSKTRTVGVRVVITNEEGRLKPGEFARATLRVPFQGTDDPAGETVMVPRDAVLAVGETGLVYVEKGPGEFELRHVVSGPSVGNEVAILSGLSKGEMVVARSTFLLDAQMQLAGNPSLIDPNKAVKKTIDPVITEEIRLAMANLNDTDRMLAEQQSICPVTEFQLGSMGMGTPIRVDLNGSPVFICCEGCRDSLLGEPEKYKAIIADHVKDNKKKPDPVHNPELPVMNHPRSDLPQMNLPQMNLPQMNLPQMNLPQMKPPG